MKKNTLMMALLTGALIAPELLAQQNPNRQRPPRQGQQRDRISRLAEELKLTEKQREQWAKVTAEQSEKQRALFANRDVPIEKRREQFAALRKETQEKQEKILTKEQLAKYKELNQRRPSRPGQGPSTRPGPGQGPGEGRPGGRPGEGRPGGRQGRGFGGFGFGRNQDDQLDLSEKQKEKMAAIQEAQGTEVQKMLQDLRDGGGDFQAMREKLTAMREKYEKQRQAVLTDEQKKKDAELRAQRDQGGQGGRGRGSFGSRDPFAGIDGIKDEQKKKLDAARQEMSTQMRGIFSDRDTPREERTAKMQEIRDAYEATIKKTLTEEQFKKYQESRSSGGGRGQGQGRRPGQGGFGGSRDPYAGIDGIKEEQKTKLDAAREEMSTQMRPLYSRDSDLSREERSAKMQKIRDAYEATVKKTLTEEQFKKYQESRSRRGGRRPGGERTRPQREDF